MPIGIDCYRAEVFRFNHSSLDVINIDSRYVQSLNQATYVNLSVIRFVIGVASTKR